MLYTIHAVEIRHMARAAELAYMRRGSCSTQDAAPGQKKKQRVKEGVSVTVSLIAMFDGGERMSAGVIMITRTNKRVQRRRGGSNAYSVGGGNQRAGESIVDGGRIVAQASP